MIKKINAESALITWSFYCEHFRQGVGLYTLYYTLYVIITSIITKFQLIKRIIKQINTESTLITLSCYLEHYRQGVGALYIIITSIVTKLVGHRCLMWEKINYRITRRRAESGMGAQPLFLIYFFVFFFSSIFGSFYLSFSISCFFL